MGFGSKNESYKRAIININAKTFNFREKKLFFISKVPNLSNYKDYQSLYEKENILGIIIDFYPIKEDSFVINLSEISHNINLIFKNGSIFGKLNILKTPNGQLLKEFIESVDFEFKLNMRKFKEGNFDLMSIDIDFN